MSSHSPIAWNTTKRIARRISSEEPFSSSYLAMAAKDELAELTRTAQECVVNEIGLNPSGALKVRATDRAGWVDANAALFDRLLRPLSDKLAESRSQTSLKIGSQVTGTQLGLVLGWMSTRVLGQYDPLLEEDRNEKDQDWLYYVVPNMMGLEKRYGFPPTQFRLWIALHECTHRAQFSGVDWLGSYFKGLVHSLLSDMEQNSKSLGDGIKKLLNERKSDINNLGIADVFASKSQKQIIEKITGLMALLEGHADVVMSRAATSLVPESERFQRVMSMRRTNSVGLTKIFQKLLGLEAKLRQYIEGATFVRDVEAAGGKVLFDRVWNSPECLPTASEIREPKIWIERMS